jgi:hypothetical protein
MYALSSYITIGQYAFKVHEVSVHKSLHNYMDKAVIKIPISARVKRKDGSVTESMSSAKYFTVGDKVDIALGYDGKLVNEFIGFVSRINFSTPLEVECEGFAHQLRNKTIKGSWKKTTVKDILKLMIEGTDIVLMPEMDNVHIPIDNLIIPNDQTCLGVLDYFKQHLFCSIFFRNNEIFCGVENTVAGKNIKHKLGYNVLKDSDLKERRNDETNVQVNIKGKNADGTNEQIQSGKAGGKVINKTTPVTDKAALKKMADKILAINSFDGYEGKITTFLMPHTQPGDASELLDPKYEDRSGKYLIESIEVKYSPSGARRINELGVKLK